jgi:hypothetical protein
MYAANATLAQASVASAASARAISFMLRIPTFRSVGSRT